MTEKLKPCPFCGGIAKIIHLGGCFRVRCDWCYIETAEYKDERSAVNAWNRKVKE